MKLSFLEGIYTLMAVSRSEKRERERRGEIEREKERERGNKKKALRPSGVMIIH